MNETLRRKLTQRLAAARGLRNPIQREPQKGPPVSEHTIPAIANNNLLPLSHAQERMWFLHQLDPNASAYNVCVLWHLNGKLNKNALQKSAKRLTDRHSILRTVYLIDEQGNARQRVLPSLPPEWNEHDLRTLAPEQRPSRLHAIAQIAGTAAFDLSSRSTLRLELVALDDSHHTLVMVGQHIVWDGPSFGVFSQDLADGYHLFSNGQPDQYPPPPSQYIDFAHWHRQRWQSSTQRGTELAFWESQLTPLPEPLNFPTDFERGLSQNEAGDWCTESVDADTTASMLQLAAQEKLTPFEVFVATIALLMTRLARSSEVTIGTIASHRNLPELTGVIGNFGNVVPLRLPVLNHWSFRQLLQHCAERCRSAFSHADVPFEYLLEHFNIARGESSSPLLDTMVTFLSHGMEAPPMQGLDVHWKKHFNGTSQIDLSFDALLLNGCLQLQATWRRSLYHPNTVPNHLKRLASLLRECVASPDEPLAQQRFLLPKEHTLLTQHWGSRTALPAQADTLVTWFENTAHERSQAIAIHEVKNIETKNPTHLNNEPGLSFCALNSRANVLARWLITQGIGPEDQVGIALARNAAWFVAMLATLKTGASFVPIDPVYPVQYIEEVLKQATPTLSFIDELSSENAQLQGAVSLHAVEKAAHQANLSDKNLTQSERRQPLLPAHPACIVFTSGSSGTPKGVVVSHSALVNLLSSHREDLYKEASQRTDRQYLRVGHAWSLAFDAAWQPTLWMFEGHEVHLFDSAIMQDPIALAKQIMLRKLDFIELTPGMLDIVLPWLQSGLTESDGQQFPPHVPAILGFGGESVKQALWQRIVKLENTTGVNLYGPTEATVDAMIAHASSDETPNIGRPVAGAQAYVLDTCLQLTPPGVAGELAIAGAGLARGYLKRGDLTAKQFIANPHGEPGSRLYRTGDRVRWLPGGVLEYIGRIDEQVKIRGFRVEPLEVETTVEKIIQHPCAVVARPSESGTMQLLCFVETEQTDNTTNSAEVTSDPQALRQLCSTALPAHLLPAHMIPIERLPRLPNGKIHRQALTTPDGLSRATGRLPSTALEIQLCQLFAEVLGLEQVSIDDSFFELGGDSISVVKLVSLARRHGLTITARQLFDARSIAQLIPQIENSPALKQQIQEHDSADTGVVMPTPLMLNYLLQSQPLQRFAQIVSLALPAEINETQIEALLDAALQRHAMLRARLTESCEGLPCLHIPSNETDVQTKVHSIELLSADEFNNHTDAKKHSVHANTIARQLCEQLNPSEGIMLAAALVRGQQHDDQVLWLAINHLVIDASSWHILVNDLALGHMAQKREEPIKLPSVPTAWRNWSAALKPPYLTDSHFLKAKKREPRGTLASTRRKSWTLPQHRGQCPAAMAARKLGLPLSNLLPAVTALAALRADLVPQKFQQKICLCIEQHGREPSASGQDLSRTIGWFARELTVHLPSPVEAISPNDKNRHKNVLTLLRQWCGEIIRLDKPAIDFTNEDQYNHSDDSPAGGNSRKTQTWQLGFNYLGTLGDTEQAGMWEPQPRLELLTQACGDHWPLLHDLNINAHYRSQGETRLLHFDALGPAAHIDDSSLTRLFKQLHKVFNLLMGINTGEVMESAAAQNRPTTAAQLKQVTALQYDMLRHCQGDSDPWTTQMELSLVTSPEQSFSAQSLQQNGSRLLSRHEALRAGFLPDCASTFFLTELEPDWQNLDWSNNTTQQQQSLLDELRQHFYQSPFRLDKPPLLRFVLIRLSHERWRLLVNCHHLLLDGWSVPRILHELLTGACAQPATTHPTLCWSDYLDWLHTQDFSASWRYWNRALQDLKTPSLFCPERTHRTPTKDLQQTLSTQQSQSLTESAKRADISSAALYQLAWAHTLASELGQADVVFGLFDSGRASPLDGLESLVGLVTQLIPLRIDTASPLTVKEQLQALQTRLFECQSLPPIRLDNLEASIRLGELFDSLLVIENALEADTEISDAINDTPTANTTPLSMIEQQHWQDSIGQAVGLFVYPGNPVKLRLCFDPQATAASLAERVLSMFTHHLQCLLTALDADIHVSKP